MNKYHSCTISTTIIMSPEAETNHVQGRSQYLWKGGAQLASFPGPTSQTIGKAGGGFWHVTDVKLRRHGRGFPLAKRCTNARLRDRAQKSERRRILARGRYKDQNYPSWSLYRPLAKTRRLSDFCARSRSRALVQRFANGNHVDVI